MEDIRWIQRLSNFNKALSNLKEAVDVAESRELNKLEKQGLIQSFEEEVEELLTHSPFLMKLSGQLQFFRRFPDVPRLTFSRKNQNNQKTCLLK